MTDKKIASIMFLLSVLFYEQTKLEEIVPNTSVNRPPIGLYKRTTITRDKETIASFGGAPVGVYRKHQYPVNARYPVRGWNQHKKRSTRTLAEKGSKENYTKTLFRLIRRRKAKKLRKLRGKRLHTAIYRKLRSFFRVLIPRFRIRS